MIFNDSSGAKAREFICYSVPLAFHFISVPPWTFLVHGFHFFLAHRGPFVRLATEESSLKATKIVFKYAAIFLKNNCRERERDRQTDRRTEKTRHAVDYGKGEESFLLPSQRSPRARHSLPQSSCSLVPLENPREPLRRRHLVLFGLGRIINRPCTV